MTFHVTLDGRLGADPEIKFTAEGKTLASLRVAHTGRRKNPQTDQWEDTGTLWTAVAVFGHHAEMIAETLTKGDRVLVTGRATPRDYTHSSGEQRQALDIVADLVAQIPKKPTRSAGRPAHPGFADETPTRDGWTPHMREQQQHHRQQLADTSRTPF